MSQAQPSAAMPSPELFFETAFVHQRTAALKAAVDLDVFTAIQDGARTAKSIAGARGASERGIRILCDYLTTMGFLEKTAAFVRSDFSPRTSEGGARDFDRGVHFFIAAGRNAANHFTGRRIKTFNAFA